MLHIANDFLNEDIVHISATMLVVNQRRGYKSLDPQNDFGFLYSIVSKLFHSLPLPLVPPPLVSTILQFPSAHEMLSLPCTRSLLSILILIIHSAMPAEVLPLAVALTPSPTSSHENMAIVQAQALIAFKDAITNDPSSYCVFTQKEDANQISHKQ